MKENEKSSQEINDNQKPLEIPQNQSLTHPSPDSKENISLQKHSRVLFQANQSGKYLLRSFQNAEKKEKTIEIQPLSLFVRSGSQNPHPKNFEPPQQKAPSQRIFSAISNSSKLHSQQDSIIRSKTMIQTEKKYEESSQTNRHKLPQAILDYIMTNAKLKNQSCGLTRTETGKRLGRLGLSKKLSQKYNTKLCLICETEVHEKEFQKITKTCQHSYCSSCLHHYVIYKINAFEAVTCPNEECNQPLDQDCQLYQELPLQVRKKYKKLLQYQMVKQHPNRKMCPEENCQGWIEINEQLDPICNVCKNKYCGKCLLPHHDGDCDNKQLQFFQGTLHYRQCNKCKNVIQKSSGCIHMTCTCGYQFCYLCGAKWKHSHTCANPDEERLHREGNCCCCEIDICDCDCDDCLERFCDIMCCCCENGCTCDCDCCCDCCQGGCCECDCCDNNQCLRGFLGCLFKGFLVIVWVVFLIPLFLIFDILFLGCFWLFITLLSGLTMYTIEIISQLEGCCFVMAIIFYPITAFAGIGLAFRQVFIEVFLTHVSEVCQTMCDYFREIFDD